MEITVTREVIITPDYLNKRYDEIEHLKTTHEGETFRTYEHDELGEMASYIITIDDQRFFFSPEPFDGSVLKDYKAGNVNVEMIRG